jgi:hypothetical protein
MGRGATPSVHGICKSYPGMLGALMFEGDGKLLRSESAMARIKILKVKNACFKLDSPFTTPISYG